MKNSPCRSGIASDPPARQRVACSIARSPDASRFCAPRVEQDPDRKGKIRRRILMFAKEQRVDNCSFGVLQCRQVAAQIFDNVQIFVPIHILGMKRARCEVVRKPRHSIIRRLCRTDAGSQQDASQQCRIAPYRSNHLNARTREEWQASMVIRHAFDRITPGAQVLESPHRR